jgi:hypothetical protein
MVVVVDFTKRGMIVFEIGERGAIDNIVTIL